jgi:replication-associated recombination protein RarA
MSDNIVNLPNLPTRPAIGSVQINIGMFLFGPPGSGKSVFADWLTKVLEANGIDMICDDEHDRIFEIRTRR